jgi:hypothetical protein
MNVCLAHLGVQNAIFILDIVFFCMCGMSRVESRRGDFKEKSGTFFCWMESETYLLKLIRETRELNKMKRVKENLHQTTTHTNRRNPKKAKHGLGCGTGTRAGVSAGSY